MNILLIIIIILLLSIYKKQESLLLFGKKLDDNWKPIIDYDYDEIYLPVKQDGKDIQLHGVYYKNKKESKGLVIYYHGNRGNMKTVEQYALPFLTNNYDVLIMDYRGFGGSEGNINRPEYLLEDAVLWYDWITKNYQHDNIIIVGKSLGTGVATYVASKRKSSLLMLITPYDALYRVANNKYPWLPVKFLLKYLIPSIDWLKDIKQPIRIIHGTHDETIPAQRAQSYFEEAKKLNKDVQILWLSGALHDNLHMYIEYHNWINSCLVESEIKINTSLET